MYDTAHTAVERFCKLGQDPFCIPEAQHPRLFDDSQKHVSSHAVL
jgi:hypothetical protein